MRKISFIMPLACLVLAPAAAQAQAARTWVAGRGDDAMPCTITAPCKTFAHAFALTAQGGEIDVLAPGSFGSLTITRSVTIADESVGQGGVLATGSSGIIVNAGPNDVVVLRGLQITGAPSGNPGSFGVQFNTGRSLVIDNCYINGFSAAGPNGYGVWFVPLNPSGPQQLVINHSSIAQNGQSSTSGGGIFVQPQGGAPNINVTLDNTQVSNNQGFGIRIDGSKTSGGTISFAASNVQASSNGAAGIAIGADTGNALTTANVMQSVMNGNAVGINAAGAQAQFHIGRSMITNNATGVKQSASATMDSYGGNQIANNPTPGFSLPIVGPY
jgi:hypothetical protein